MPEKPRQPVRSTPRRQWPAQLAAVRGGYLWLGLSVAAWLAFFAVAMAVPVLEDGPLILLQAGSVLLGVMILSSILLAGERPRFSPRLRWAMFGCGLAAMLIPYALNLQLPAVRALATLGLLAVALPVGYWIGDRMEKATNLIPLAVAMSLADIYSVLQGPSRVVGEKLLTHYDEVAARVSQLGSEATPQQIAEATAVLRAPLADFIVVHIPLAGLRSTVPVLGIGDFIALGFLFRAAWLHRLNARGIYISALLAIVAALATSLLSHRVIPALPFIALGVIGWLLISTPRLRRLDRQELLLTIGVAALFAMLMLARWLRELL